MARAHAVWNTTAFKALVAQLEILTGTGFIQWKQESTEASPDGEHFVGVALLHLRILRSPSPRSYMSRRSKSDDVLEISDAMGGPKGRPTAAIAGARESSLGHIADLAAAQHGIGPLVAAKTPARGRRTNKRRSHDT